jgi:hypothetical protein
MNASLASEVVLAWYRANSDRERAARTFVALAGAMRSDSTLFDESSRIIRTVVKLGIAGNS